MDTQIIFIYCVADSIVKALKLRNDPQNKMSHAEIITFVMISALFYQGNYKTTRLVMSSCRYFSRFLSHSRIVRRIHQIEENTWIIIFTIAKGFIQNKASQEYIIDSFPVAICQDYKRFRCKLFPGKKFHGYTASKKQYFFGIKVHMLVDCHGIPIEFVLTPGAESDLRGMHKMDMDIPRGSSLLADRAYTDYGLEDFLNHEREIRLIAKRKKNSKRPHCCYDQLRLSFETVFSGIQALMPRCIRAKTERGFCLKVMFFILAYTIKLSFTSL